MLNVLHPVIGCDFHQELTTTVPPVPAPMPHLVLVLLGNLPGALIFGTVKRSDNSEGKQPVLVECLQVPIILQESDIGPFIVHVPLAPFTPSPLTFFNTLGSGSTSEFFAFSVKVHDKPVAIANLVYATVNLNCGFPCSAPTGLVAAPATVFAGFRWGDLLAGLAGMAMDAALSWAINAAFNGTSLKGDGGLLGSNGVLANRMVNGTLRSIFTNAGFQAGLQYFLGSFGLLGSPMGYSNSNSTFLGHYYAGFKSGTTQGIADYFNPPSGAVMQ